MQEAVEEISYGTVQEETHGEKETKETKESLILRKTARLVSSLGWFDVVCSGVFIVNFEHISYLLYIYIYIYRTAFS